MSQSAKTGGNKKQASPSDEAYFVRYKAGNMQETHRVRRVKRHEKRMAKKAAHRLVWAAKKAQRRPFSEAA